MMKTLLCGCAALSLLAGLSGRAVAEDQELPPPPNADVREAPIHAVPPDAADSETAQQQPPDDEQQPSGTAQPSALDDDERAFFAAVGRRVTDSASAYSGYVRNTAAIDPSFGGPAAVQRALRTGTDYQPRQLQEGMIAFAALIALRDQAFVDGVRADPDPDLAQRLLRSPEAVLEVPGAGEAAADVAGVLRAHGLALEAKGQAITATAYSMQSQAWSDGAVADQHRVVENVEASAVEPRAADEISEKALLRTLVTTPRSPVGAGEAPSRADVQGLALAALAILGRAGDAHESYVEALLYESAAADCLRDARLQLDGCLAAAGPHYEDAFCAGRHAVGETAKCISAASTATADAVGSTDNDSRRAAAPGYGPEAAGAYGYGPARAGDDAPPRPDTEAAPDAGGYPDRRFDGYGDAGPPPPPPPQPPPPPE